MLTRRQLGKLAAFIGLGTVFPLNVFRIPASSLQAHARPLDTTHPKDTASNLMAIEAWEDLWDDLDYEELVAQYTTLGGIEVLPRVSAGYTPCPFHHAKTHRALTFFMSDPYDRKIYYFKDCDRYGTTMEYYAAIEGVSYGEAVRRLRNLLDAGVLQGQRPRYEALWAIMDDTIQLYHRTMTREPEGEPGRRWLEQEGITRDTIERFLLGYAPKDPCYLYEHLLARGYSIRQMERACLAFDWPMRGCTPIDPHLAAITIPVRDQQGHAWGLLFRRVEHDGVPSSSFRSDLEGMGRLSKNRFRRIIFPLPTWPRDLNQHQRVLLTEDPVDVLVLTQEGINNAIWMGNALGDGRMLPFRLRTALGLAPRLICPYHTKADGSTLFVALLGNMSECLDRVDLLLLPKGHSVRDILRREGVAALRDRLAHPVAIRDVLAL